MELVLVGPVPGALDYGVATYAAFLVASLVALVPVLLIGRRACAGERSAPESPRLRLIPGGLLGRRAA